MVDLNDAFSVAPLRTPIGKVGGGLRTRTADQWRVDRGRGAVARAGSRGAPAACLRSAMPACTAARRWESRPQGVVKGVVSVLTGQSAAVCVGGVQSMSDV